MNLQIPYAYTLNKIPMSPEVAESRSTPLLLSMLRGLALVSIVRSVHLIIPLLRCFQFTPCDS